MKHLCRLTILMACAIFACSAFARELADETVTYKVMYKWGLINKKAGTVLISLSSHPAHYDAKLTASSASWADKIYKVRDTLLCQMHRPDLKPVFYEKMSHEGGDDKHDRVDYSYDGQAITGHCTRYEARNGKVKKDEKRTLTSEGPTFDMLSAYYYMRTLPYEDWQPGHKIQANIFSGKRKELLTIEYHGIERVEYDGLSYDCYYITFIFTSDGKTKTSDDMMAWITTDDQRLPVKLEGKLPIGSIKCYMTSH